jgi:hypothetical protein
MLIALIQKGEKPQFFFIPQRLGGKIKLRRKGGRKI